MSPLSLLPWIETIPAVFNPEGNSPSSMQELKFSAINLAIRSLFSLMVLKRQPSRVVLSKRCSENMQQIYREINLTMLRLLIVFSTSLQLAFLKWKVESKRFGLDFDYTRVFVRRFNYRHNRIKIVTCHQKRLRFWYVQSGYHIRQKLIKCLTKLLVTGYGFTIISEVNFFTF